MQGLLAWSKAAHEAAIRQTRWGSSRMELNRRGIEDMLAIALTKILWLQKGKTKISIWDAEQCTLHPTIKLDSPYTKEL